MSQTPRFRNSIKAVIIREGSVDVWADTPEGRLKLATLPAGESFGEVSILTGEVCNATVTEWFTVLL